jgi:hypothetical protein
MLEWLRPPSASRSVEVITCAAMTRSLLAVCGYVGPPLLAAVVARVLRRIWLCLSRARREAFAMQQCVFPAQARPWFRRRPWRAAAGAGFYSPASVTLPCNNRKAGNARGFGHRSRPGRAGAAGPDRGILSVRGFAARSGARLGNGRAPASSASGRQGDLQGGAARLQLRPCARAERAASHRIDHVRTT